MKALIRSPDEIVKESYGIPGIDWETGAPLTNPFWEGGRPYTLIRNYVEPAEADASGEESAADPVPEQRTIMVDGKEYVLKL